MIFRDSNSQLQANNLCRFEKPYAQPVVTAADVTLQCRLPNQGANDYEIEIKLFNCNGETYLKEITGQFRIQFAKSITGFRYCNLQLLEFGEEWPSDCFTIQVEIKNNGQVVFNKITETYSRLQANKRCYIELTENEWDNFSLGYKTLIVNSETVYDSPDDLPADFEPVYQSGTQMWHLYFDCTNVLTIALGIKELGGLALPLAGPLGGFLGESKLFPIYAVYSIDDSGCRLPYSRIESTYECIDNITGLYYGDAIELLNYSNNDPDLKYSNSQWIESEIRKTPTEYQKEISYLGRIQRVDYVELFSLKGLIPFPEWKFQELETLFAGKRLFLDSVEYIHAKGAVFKKDTIRCTCNWLLDAELEKKVLINEFSCVEDCIMLCYYFVIYGGTKDQAYYDENGNLIGLLFSELYNYFHGLPDVISVTEVSTEDFSCDPVAVIKIKSLGTVPAFIYYWELSPTNRIYVRRDDCQNPNNLCDGLEGMCPVPSNITLTCI